MKNNSTWHKAVVIGSIWASIEIIFGSFFHTLRIPFAGTFLTFTSIVLLSAFAVKWNEKNLFLKAGLITALMRSLVPTSVIIGPFIGILTEAILFQIAVNLFGTRFIAFALAGILSMFSAVLHKIVSIILIYGWDIVKILERIYFIFLKTTKLDLPPGKLFKIVVIVYTLLGILAAWLGIYTGKKNLKTNEKKEIPAIKKEMTSIFDLNEFDYKPVLIYLHILALITGFILITRFSLIYFMVFFIPYEIFLILRYGKNLRRLGKWVFWVQLGIILLVSMLLWPDKKEGLLAGFKMILRAFWLISIFIAISIELKNPVIKILLGGKSLNGLYESLHLATGILPRILSRLSEEKKLWFNPLKLIGSAISVSDSILEELEKNHKTKVFLITGETSEGKTRFLKNLVRELKKRNPAINISGFYSEGVWDSKNNKIAYDLTDLNTNQKVRLCDRKSKPGFPHVGQFYFYPEAIRSGEEILKNSMNADLVIIDEVGNLELNRQGWFPAIKELIQNEKPMIWTCKNKLSTGIQEKFPGLEFHLINIRKNNIFETVNFIEKEIFI